MQEKEVKKSGRGGWRGGGRPVTPYKKTLYVRVTKEAKEMVADVKNLCEYIDSLIKKDYQERQMTK